MSDQKDQHSEGEADFRGPFGYGRPAYRPDPDAKYGFEPDPKRILPPRGGLVMIEVSDPDSTELD